MARLTADPTDTVRTKLARLLELQVRLDVRRTGDGLTALDVAVKELYDDGDKEL